MNFFTIFHQKYGLTVSPKTPKSAFGNSPFLLSSRVVVEWLKLRFGVPWSESAIPMIAFLLAFVTSTLICASIVFAYPLLLFLRGEKEMPIRIVLSNIAWLILAFAFFILGS